ncbi:PREDICTED: F-box protein At2g39490-like isoform X1 [Tarenaya hassleriana]|uniref:F-box protein At2g39490-like isoform X1 n=1 Tax=Tarenaya hassleriana TaxID=28532 RepID=UPI00053C7A33|nr:PREDICTED: F-box protein At2g39490-like isoform X1 [Tarenaya hassleriana]
MSYVPVVIVMDEQATDRISGLPDEILLRIISFLPFESLIHTILLSRRWRLLWNQTDLVLHGNKEDISGAVSNFLAGFDENDPMRNTRKLCFHFNGGHETLVSIFAPGEVLHLKFSSEEPEGIGLRRFSWKLELSSHFQRDSAFFVRSLNLFSVTHLTSDVISSIFSNSHLLESLKIVRCLGMTSLRVDSTVKLVHLTVLDCPQLQSLEIVSFKLKTLRFRGFFPVFCITYHFNLTDAMFDTRQGLSCNVPESFPFDPVLLTIKNSEVLTLSKWIFEAFICPSLSMFRADFQLYRLKELWWIDSSLHRENIDSLISFLKLCPSLERLFVTIDPGSYCVNESAAYSKLIGQRTRLENLELVRLEGCINHDSDMLSLSEALQEIVTTEIVTVSSSSVKKSHLNSSKRRYVFVEGEEARDLCKKHPHMGL